MRHLRSIILHWIPIVSLFAGYLFGIYIGSGLERKGVSLSGSCRRAFAALK